jgi:aldehyde:ferredoxin oxidoreductase
MYGMGNRGMCHIHPLEGMAYDSYKNDFGLIPHGIPDPNDVSRFDEEGKGKIAKMLQDFGTIPDVVGICKFFIYNGLGPTELAEMLSLLTGWSMSDKELLKIGERVYTLQRMFNVREGMDKKDDMLPERILKLPECGKYSLVRECEIRKYSKMLEECYAARGWSLETGIPSDDKLRELGLRGYS